MAKQLRGEALHEAIKTGIHHLAKQTDNYIYNSTELAKLIGTSRPTLAKNRELIDKELKRIDAQRRTSTGSGITEHLLAKIERLEKDNSELEGELKVLRQHHTEIYQRLYLNSYDMSQLIKPIIIEESEQQQKCSLCGSQFHKDQVNKSNIIKLHPEGDK